ncbi:MAG: bis(5'-nucleosyl)-tetraphosphatase (symmetrical) YqeK [Lachnospira sp.]|nr:bis(5'-nucleosyl)-tetraphosphatase (symmetrical) YqeK [Lachnospira sp.]
MNNEYVNSLRKNVKKAFKDDKSRYHHTIAVANTAACLAFAHGADSEKAFIAGLLHDCAKCISDEELIHICTANNIPISEAEYASPYLLHAKVGAFYAQNKYMVEDEDILNAITYHTTGRPQMSLLEEIVFLADYIEPYRNKANNLNTVRSEAFKDIKEAIYIVTRDTLNYLKRTGKTIDSLTYDTYKFYEAETCDRDFLIATDN